MIRVLTAIVLALVTSSAQATVKFDFFTLYVSTYSQAQNATTTVVQGNDNNVQTPNYQPFFSRTTNAPASLGDALVTSSASGFVDFAHPGSLRFTATLPRQFVSYTNDLVQASASGQSVVQYLFTLDRAYTFSLSNFAFGTSFPGNNVFAGSAYSTAVTLSRFNNGMGITPIVDGFAPGPQPTYSGTLAAGSYALRLDVAGVFNANSTGVADAFFSADSTFDFALSAAVPEPATWLSFIIGFGLTGAMARRRYPRAATIWSGSAVAGSPPASTGAVSL